MSPTVQFLIIGGATLGGFLGALTPAVVRWLGNGKPLLPTRSSSKPAVLSTADRLDPRLADRVQQASRDWAESRGRPEAAPLAHGYFSDAARDLQQRWGPRS